MILHYLLFSPKYFELSSSQHRTYLVVQICLSMQGTGFDSLVWGDPTCRGATKPMHNYGACAQQQEKPLQ